MSIPAELLHQGVMDCVTTQDFKPLLQAVVSLFESKGVSIYRLQIPMTKHAGFRHPLFAVLLLTWRDKGIVVEPVTHEQMAVRMKDDFREIRDTPYSKIFFEDVDIIQFDLRKERPYHILQKLHTEEAVTDYCALLLPFPLGGKQVMSIATTHVDGFPDDLRSIVQELRFGIATALFAVYQNSVSLAVATTYLGERTGMRVLKGEISRGSQHQLDAGIMFCDIRGFTSMSEALGAEGIIPVINEIFDIIGGCVTSVGGEILKFIGDAMLVIFPYDSLEEEEKVAQNMIKAAQKSITEVEALGGSHEFPVSVGFGCHIGEVLYGNIGTLNRFDFTVMGPAVNLTSRLEGLCKPLGVKIIASERVYQKYSELTHLGVQKVKGVSEPISVFGILHEE